MHDALVGVLLPGPGIFGGLVVLIPNPGEIIAGAEGAAGASEGAGAYELGTLRGSVATAEPCGGAILVEPTPGGDVVLILGFVEMLAGAEGAVECFGGTTVISDGAAGVAEVPTPSGGPG